MLLFIIICLFIQNARATLLWSDKPIRYKQYFEVQTHEDVVIGPLGMLTPTFTTYIFDMRYAGQPEGILHMTSSLLMEHARIAHENSLDWLFRHHAHLRITVPCNHETVGVYRPPSAPRSGQRNVIPDVILPEAPPLLERAATDLTMVPESPGSQGSGRSESEPKKRKRE